MYKPLKIFSFLIILFLVLPLFPYSLYAQQSPDAEELTSLLNEFLEGASVGNAEIHERFWAEDLIYTSSSGQRMSKSDILHGLRSSPDPDPGITYSAEEIQIQQYDNTAIVAFKLVALSDTNERTEYYNTGTFLKRNEKWQVVSWQATLIPND